MSEDTTKTASPTQWKWVIIGVVAGIIIIGGSYFVVAPTFHSAAIQSLVVLIGFVVTGAVVGYFSPGVTIKEAFFAGLILMFVFAILFSLTALGEGQSTQMIVLLLIFGGILSQAGAWMGEKLQGTLENKEVDPKAAVGFQWKWVLAGLALGLVLNVLFVFLLAPLFNINLNLINIAFSISFVVLGFIIGYKSPGVTLKEPAVAGAIAVVGEWLFIQYGIQLSVPVGYVAFGVVEGFLLTLFGAWLGERYQAAKESKQQVA
ncbi:MAG TPA: hypothetical protein VMG34_04840 [Bacteroidota bacterium]|nr:hypothetical protein [Bacteroidota bacterium]